MTALDVDSVSARACPGYVGPDFGGGGWQIQRDEGYGSPLPLIKGVRRS